MRRWLLTSIVLTACSGSAGTDLLTANNEQASSPALPKPAVPTGSAVGHATPAPTPADDAGVVDAATPHDAAAEASPSDAGPAVDAGDGCTHEIEDDGTLAKATAFTKCLEGYVFDQTDTDYGKIDVPAGKTQITFSHTESDPIAYRLYVDGIAVPVPVLNNGDDGAVDLPVVPGTTIGIQLKVRGMPNVGRSYRVDITFR